MTAVPAKVSKSAWNAWGETDPGKQRSNNEDRIYCDSQRGIFIIADGMGGEAAGEVAAQHAVDSIKKRLRRETGTVARRLREAIAGANNEVYRLAERNSAWRGMACVLTAAVMEDGVLHVGHVGDTRLYKIRDRQISKITSDHSPVGKREDAGEITELEAMRHPRRNEVFRDVGSQIHTPDDEDFVEYAQVLFEADAALVLCSDGLSDLITSAEILATVLRNAGRPKESVRELIAQANAAGGKDNVSVIVVEGGGLSVAATAAASNAQKTRESASDAGSRPAHALRRLSGRWAFLAYGLLAGLFLGWLWLRYGGAVFRADAPQTVPGSAPRVLIVEPASPRYPSISKALEDARPGDRIEVVNGEYQEAIRLKQGVEITARTPGKAILHIVRAQPGTDAAVVADGISGTILTGLVVRAESTAALPYGLRISNSDIFLSNVEVTGAVQTGVLFNGNSKSMLTGSLIHGNAGPGIAVTGTASPYLSGNVIHANGMTRERTAPGLYVTENANPEVARNIFSGNGADAIRVQRPELRDKMLDNLFVGPTPGKVTVERAKK
jgi:serine/threonine protein phosphatase PrpC